MDMSVDDYDFTNMDGVSGVKYFSSNWASKAKQNILKCGEIGGRVISVEEIISENLVLDKTFVTSDKLVIHDYRLSCFLSGVELSGIACVRHMSITASKGQRIFGNGTADIYYKEILDMYAETTLFVTVNQTHVSLEFNPLCYVICTVAPLSAPRDSMEALLQAKYGLYEQILEHYESELNILQAIAVYSVENGKRVNDGSVLSNFCSELSSELLHEVGLSEITRRVSRNRFLDFVSRFEGAYIKASEAYLLIMEDSGNICVTGKSSNLAVILSEHIALKQHIRSQLSAFMKGKDLPQISGWKFLCLHQDSCGPLVTEIEEVLSKKLSDLEASYFLIEIHNALARFVNGVCNRGFATCERMELITINALQMSHSVAKIRRSFTKEQSIRESKADIPSNSYSQRRVKRWVFTSFLASIGYKRPSR